MAAQQTQHAQRLIVTLRRHLSRYLWVRMLLLVLVVFTFTLLTSGHIIADPDFPKPLIERYQDLQTELAQNVFGAPIVLNSDTSKHHAQGEVFAKLEIPIGELKDLLSQPDHWCELAIVHINIKTCTYRAKPDNKQLTIYLGRKYYQEPSQAYPLKYTFEHRANDDNHLYVRLTAKDGPFGTHDYLISFEAVPIDDHHSFIRFQYRYHFGFLARIAMNTYLATIGHKKVGFTIDGTDLEGNPDFVKGVQGVVERNAIRYIYAIQSLLDVRHLPAAERQQKSFTTWYSLISRHPRQLVEFTLEEYLSRKGQELKNQLVLQKNS